VRVGNERASVGVEWKKNSRKKKGGAKKKILRAGNRKSGLAPESPKYFPREIPPPPRPRALAGGPGFATVYAAYALLWFSSRRRPAFILPRTGGARHAAAALLHGPALAGLGIAAAFVTADPGFFAKARLLGAVYLISPSSPAAAFGLARIRLCAGSQSPPLSLRAALDRALLQCGPSMVAPHAFHVIAGFALAALLVVCGFLVGHPPRRPDRADLVGSLAGLSPGRDHDRARKFSRRCRDRRVRGAGGCQRWPSHGSRKRPPARSRPRPYSSSRCSPKWAVRGNSDLLVLPGGPLPGIGGPHQTEASGNVASGNGRAVRRHVRAPRISGARPFGSARSSR